MNVKGPRLLWFVVVVLIIMAIPFFACKAQAQKEPIKIGICLDQTGFIAFAGIEGIKGIQLGLEDLFPGGEFNGRPVRLIIEDAASDAGPSMDKMKKLVERDKVCLVIGPINGGGSQATFHYLNTVNIPRLDIQPADIPNDFDRTKPYNQFSVHGSSMSMAYTMGAYAYEKLGYKTAVVHTADFIAGYLFTGGFKKGFEDRGGKVLQEVFYPPGTNDMTPYFIKLQQADCMCAWWPGHDGLVAFPQYKNLGIKMPIVQPEDGGLTASPPALKELGANAVGCVTAGLYSYMLDTPKNKVFVEKYKKKFNEIPGPFSGAGYANMEVLLAALKATKGDTSSAALKKAIRGLKIDTLTGPVEFTQSNNNISTCTPMILKINEKYEPMVVNLPVVIETWPTKEITKYNIKWR
jgi:branched-chain amino acid transport system substrate-binding protein